MFLPMQQVILHASNEVFAREMSLHHLSGSLLNLKTDRQVAIMNLKVTTEQSSHVFSTVWTHPRTIF